jgi:CubicO group peptidase (beta-lactamase class C family)
MIFSSLVQNIENQAKYSAIHSLLIAHKGEIVLEKYFGDYTADTLHEAQSVTKSLQSILIGIAIDKGFIENTALRIKPFFAEYDLLDWDTSKAEITIRHLLMMSEGLDWNESRVPYTAFWENDANRQMMSYDWVGYALGKSLQYKPGTQFNYSSANPILLSKILKESTGMPQETFAKKYLFEPLGIEAYEYQHSPQDPEVLADIYMLPRDLLKIGQMMLQKGRWNEQQIVSENWVNESTQFQIQPPDTKAKYGYMWWIDKIASKESKIPYYYAWGYGGQHIFAAPVLDLVAVFTGNRYTITLAPEPLQIWEDIVISMRYS